MAQNGPIEWSVEIFLLQITKNASICKKKWLKLKFETSDLQLSVGTPVPDLVIFRKIFVNEVLVDFFDFDWLGMLDIADYGMIALDGIVIVWICRFEFAFIWFCNFW